ncbi:ArpU family phage packaging/lysis transcriptional regulator [Priestia filamentosa]|nr:ArpU family phage packaging/lysis transcriptional regulator [Priestia filamentosa]
MAAEQLSFFYKLNEKEIRKVIVNELKYYRALKVRKQNMEERKAAGIINLFPALHQADHQMEMKAQQIERALECLDATEKAIIEMKYLHVTEVNDLNVFMELGLKKGKYYELKRGAISRLATALGII